MAQIQPFTAVVYRHEESPDITPLVAPPYDVITPKMRERLLENEPHNVVAIDLPEGDPDPAAPANRYANAEQLWHAWRKQGVLVYDNAQAMYVLEQTWEHEGRHVRRRALLAAVELHDFSDGVILPHEKTLPKTVMDRLYLTRACTANLSPVFGLFTDPAGETDGIFDEATLGNPMLVARDADGVESRMWALREPEAIESLASMMADKQIFIADGHHRYEMALAYRDERRAADAEAGTAAASRPYDYVLMALVNMDDPDLVVMPTHRLVRAPGTFDTDAFWAALSERFDLVEQHLGTLAALAAASRPCFVVKTADGTVRLASLKREVDPAVAIPGEASAAWKNLDVSVLHELVLRPLFQISPDDAASLERLSFTNDAHQAFGLMGADVAFIMNPTRMDQLRSIALSGQTMPQKSTYFYPKLLTGMVFRPMD
ncbi:MAG: DUF1015 domain-containing protein [Actinomycetia bacterium]|nr:DUF1015 domain-containing protein [Actinomycetes bacterium]